MFLTFYKKECGFFLWIDQTISHGIKDRLPYSPQPWVTRFQPYGEIKEEEEEENTRNEEEEGEEEENNQSEEAEEEGEENDRNEEEGEEVF